MLKPPSKPDAPAVRLANIYKRYGQSHALRDVSLEIGGGVTGLLGPNGSGKTTLIKVLLGLVKINHGSGEVLGQPLGASRAIRACIGYMPEDDCYLPGVTGVEMVRFAAQLSGIPGTEALRRAHEILDFCGAEQERYRNVETYSVGMRQKLKFAQSIVHDPPFLIFDEPTTGLDPGEREIMLHRIRVLAHRGQKTVLLSTHILPDVQAVCDNVIILAQGEVRIVDSMANLSRPTSPSFEVRVQGDAAALKQRLASSGLEVRLEDDGALVVLGEQEHVGRAVMAAAEAAGVGIRGLTPAKNSLERIFLDAVRDKQQAAEQR